MGRSRMSKRTHKLRGMGDVGAVIGAAASIADAAAKLGVARSTVHRWVTSGKAPKPAGMRSEVAASVADVLAGAREPSAWAEQVRQARPAMDATETALLELAADTLTLARGEGHPMVRLAAMTRFQALVKQLRLDGGTAQESPAETSKPAAAPRRAVTHDPRRILSAVK